MVAQQYPVGVKVFIDDVDATKWLFGETELNPDAVYNTWRNIDISSFINTPGIHRIKVTCTGGVGRVESRVEVS